MFYSQFRLYKKVFGKYKNIWCIEKANKFRSINIDKKNQKKISDFARLLKNKQNLKIFYANTKEKIFRHIFKIAIKSPLKSIDRFLSILENRLDTILLRCCFVFSIYQAKQIIAHGCISVNGKNIFNINKNIKRYDIIKYKE